MIKKIISISAIVLSLAVAFPALAQNTGVAGVVASTVSTKISCVGAAVATRESALDAAITVHAQAVQTAYTTRATELAGAYSNTTAKKVLAGTKVAWSDFNKSIKASTSAWKTSQTATWNTFKTVAKACKAPAGVSDSANSISEISGK